MPLRTRQKEGHLPSACPAFRLGAGGTTAQQPLPSMLELQGPSPGTGWSSATSVCRAPSPSSPHSRVTAATTSCLLRRRSACSSWRRPLAHWTLRLIADCPQLSLSVSQRPEVPEHCSQPCLCPGVRETVWGSSFSKTQKTRASLESLPTLCGLCSLHHRQRKEHLLP